MRTARSSLAGVTLALLILAGCSSPESPPVTDTPGPTQTDEPAGEVVLSVESTSLGDIVVDGEGRTVYVFDNDTEGTDRSACEGPCADLWPAVLTDSDDPEVEGVTGTVGTIEAIDGGMQVTLNGWPLYTYADDAAPGDVAGQAFNDVWWVVDPSGERIMTMPENSMDY